MKKTLKIAGIFVGAVVAAYAALLIFFNRHQYIPADYIGRFDR